MSYIRFDVAIISIAIALTGCAVQQKVWVKDGTTQEQFQRDQMSCRQYGMQSAMANGLAGNMFVEVWIQDETSTCLRNLGYQLQVAHNSAPATRPESRSTTTASSPRAAVMNRNDAWGECFQASADAKSLDRCMKAKGFE